MRNKVRIAPKATKGRGNRWKKGESSNCNASNKKFRQRVSLMTPVSKVASEFETLRLDSLGNMEQSDLTSSLHGKQSSMDIDQESIGSCNTFASNFTHCTNVSFSRLMEKWNPSSLLHREMVAILATVTETIQEKKGTESETEYFAVLVTMLETTEKEETLAAIAYLLSMVVRKLPESVKKLKFSELSQTFATAIVKNREKSNGYLVISLIRCLSEFIRSQEKTVLKTTSTLNVYEVILALTLDSRPRARRSAHRAIVSILKASPTVYENVEHHVLASKTAEFCVATIKATSKDNINDALHMLNLLKDIVTIVPAKALENCCKTVLGVMFLSNPLLISGGLAVFLELFSSSSPLRQLSPKLNISLLDFLQEHRPSYTDTQSLPLWATVMKEGYISLYNLEKDKCLKMIPSLLSSMLPCLESESKIVHLTVSTCIEQIIQSIIAPSLMELNHQIRSSIADILGDSLQYKYQNAWGFICGIIGTLIEHIGLQAPDLVSRFVKKLVDLREGYNTKFLPQIDVAISKAIKSLGPQIIVSVVPFEMDLGDSNQFTHSWLIPLLRDNIEKTELNTFKTFFVPMANRIETKIKTLDSVKQATIIKLYSTLHNQIWSLLPSFCRHPTDLRATFTKDFAVLLRKIIREKFNLRGHCLAALRNLISTASTEEDKSVLRYFAKGYIQDFIKIYINPETSGSGNQDILPVYETLRVYLTITDESIREKNVETVLKSLKNFDGDVALRNYLLDILLLFIPYLPLEMLQQVYSETILPMIQNPNENTSLKKVYKIVHEICLNPNCEQFIKSFKLNVINLLVGLYKSSPDKIKYLPVNSVDTLCAKGVIRLEKKHVPILLKLIIGCVETGIAKCKKSALNLLVNLPVYLGSNTTLVQSTLIDLISLNSEDLKASEILVLGHGIIDLNADELTNEVKSKLFQLLDLFKVNQRSIVKAVFEVINLWLKKSNKEELYHAVYNIVVSLNTLTDAHKKAFRHEVKVILIKLIRKFGYDMISKLVPEVYGKVLRNIRKSEARKAKARNNEATGDLLDDLESGLTLTSGTHKSTKSMNDILHEEDSDDEILSDLEGGQQHDRRSRASSRRSRKNRSETFIEEKGDEEEIVDLLASDISSKIHSSNPIQATIARPKKTNDYRMTEDGKIVFNFKEMEKGHKRKREDDEQNEEMDDEDEDDERPAKSMISKTSKGSKVSKTSRVSQVSRMSQGSRASYKPGGKGIHRPVKKRRTGIKGAKTGEEFASKKAGGDIKKKDGPDPYAYVPLNGGVLNRRKKNKFKGYFNKLITTKSKSSKRKAQ